MRVFQAVAEAIAEAGVTDVFTFLSRDIAKLAAELSLRAVHVHHARHEHVAIGMADGYARSSGRLGVALVGQGVGITNAINALVTVTKGHSQVVVFVGEVPGATSHAATFQRKHLDQRGLLDILGVEHVDLSSSGSAAGDVRAGLTLAMRRPLVMSLPEEILEAEAGSTPTELLIEPAATEPGVDDLDAIVAQLVGAPEGRTVILAGRGAVRSDAHDVLVRLGAATGAILGTSVHARGFFSGDPFAVGIVGGLSTAVARDLLGQAEVVLAFGASLSYDQTNDGTIFGDATVVQVDADRASLGRYGPVTVSVHADVRATAEALVDRLAGTHVATTGYRTPEVASVIVGYRAADTFADQSGPEGLDMRALTTALDRLLPRERTVVVDGGSCKYYPIAYLPSPDARAFIWPTEYGAIGISIGPALGAAIARPDRLTVLCSGDGGFMMTLADIETAARYGLPLLIVVYDNGGLVAEVNYLVENGYTGDDARYANPSFAAVARSVGYDAETITTLAELEALAPRLSDLRRPMLLHCRVMSAKLRPDYVSHARRRALEASQLTAASDGASVGVG